MLQTSRFQSAAKIRASAAVVLASLTLGACAEGDNEGIATLVGAGIGAFIGHEVGGHGDAAVIGTAMGAMVGASIGNDYGRMLDRRDRMAMSQARYYALENAPAGTTSDWYNPDSGNYGSYTPNEAYQRESGEYCREYTQKIVVGGEVVNGYGTACRQPDGSWKIVGG